MRATSILMVLTALLLFTGCRQHLPARNDFHKLAVGKKDHLRLATYITAHTADQMFRTEAGRREVLSLLDCYGITMVCFEVYRGGMVIPPGLIKESVSFLEMNGFEVAGGIATVPGENFGKAQEGPLGWFNWQNKKTRDDLKKVMEDSAPYFDTFIVDDFLCTSDTSLESKNARGDRSWSEYRRTLLASCARDVLIAPAKKVNPSIKMIIKYPQWYDRFHLFGYDPEAETTFFDGIWTGTETRGQYTQRFGYVQPYEGFINYRWLASVAGDKTGGAWFDHEDCNGQDFLEQAYQSVLAGVKEIVIFSFDSFITGHPGHHLLMQDFDKLAALAEEVGKHPVTGPVGYKPSGSDADGDLYLMDYIGMLGISLVPAASYPYGAGVVFLPTQAAADTGILQKINASLEKGARIIMTAGFLSRAAEGEKLAAMAGTGWPLIREQSDYNILIAGGKENKLTMPVKTDFRLVPSGAEVLMSLSGKNINPYLLCNPGLNIFIINTHTFSQADFDAAGELLLSPAQSPLLELPDSCVNILRDAFSGPGAPAIDAPARVTIQRLQDSGYFLQNYNQKAVEIGLKPAQSQGFINGFTGDKIDTGAEGIRLTMEPHSVLWLKSVE